MRVTRESLIRIAKETAQERAYNDPEIIAAYLTGSLLNVEPMLGGTADIDIVLVSKSTPTKPREFIKLTPDFHLDISRRGKDEFKNLVIVHKSIHKLIHATTEETIVRYMKELKLNGKQLEKLNKYRKSCNLAEIIQEY